MKEARIRRELTRAASVSRANLMPRAGTRTPMTTSVARLCLLMVEARIPELHLASIPSQAAWWLTTTVAMILVWTKLYSTLTDMRCQLVNVNFFMCLFV